MTKHSIERVEERVHLKRTDAIKLIDSANKRGTRGEHLPKREQTFLKTRAYNECEAIYFAGYIFIFSLDHQCITMYSPPKWFFKAQRKHGKTGKFQPSYHKEDYESIYVRGKEYRYELQ